MSLRVWLPLNGTLENKGISAITATTFETPTYVAGKIGQCYQRANSNSQLTNGINLNSNLMDILGTQASIAVWIKPLGTHTHYNGTIASSGNWNAKKWAFGVSQDNSKVDVLCGQYNTYITCAVPINEWTHLVSTFDNGTCKLYKNGEYVGQLTGQKAFETDATNACIARETYASGYFGFNGCVNDVRIYDHCLSAAEVKEISQGLVLHYKLDSIGFLHGNENFILESHKVTSGGNASGITRTYMDDGSLKIIAASGNSNYASIGFAKNSNDNVGAKLTVGDTYTLSCDIKVESGTTLPTIFINSGNGYKRLQGNFTLGQWTQVYYTSTWADPGTGYGNISLHLGFSGLVGTYYFKNFKLEKSSTPTAWCPSPLDDNYNYYMPTSVFDSSGYGHNAISNGSVPVTIDSDTIRYNYSTNFTSGARIATTYGTSTFLPRDMITINIWFKSSASANRFLSCTEGSGFNFESGSGYVRFPLYISGKGYTACVSSTTTWSSLSDNKWHMITATYNRTQSKIYIDGNLDTTTASSYPNIDIGYNAAVPFTLGAEAQTIASPIAGTYVGNLSDCRIYATALSADDILQLYHTSAKVDNKQNLHTYEFIENSSNIKLYKTGQFKAGEFQETTTTKFYKTNKIVETNNLVEF